MKENEINENNIHNEDEVINLDNVIENNIDNNIDNNIENNIVKNENPVQDIEPVNYDVIDNYATEALRKEHEQDAGREKVDVDGKGWIKSNEGLDSYKDIFKSKDDMDSGDIKVTTNVKDVDDGFDIYNEHLNGEPYKDEPKNLDIIDEGLEDEEGMEYVHDEDLMAEYEDEPLEDVPLNVTKEVQDEIDKARAAAKTQVENEHAKLKPAYDKAVNFFGTIDSLNENIQRYQDRINELSNGPDKDDPITKDNIKAFEEGLLRFVNDLQGITVEDRQAAQREIDSYNQAVAELPDKIKAAQDAAEEKVRSDAKAKQDEERYVESEKKKYRDYYNQRANIRDAKGYVDEYDAKKQEYYKQDLAMAIADAENSPKEDIYRLNILSKKNGDHIMFKRFSEKELLNAEQVFDRTFRGMENLYFKHKFKIGSGSSFLDNIYIMDEVGYQDREDIDIVQKPLGEYVEYMMNMQGIKNMDVDATTFNRYAKAFVLQVLQDNYRDLVFQPNVFGENGKLVRADLNDENYSFKLNDLPGLIDDPETRKELKNEPYQRLPFKAMIKDDPDIRDIEEVEKVEEKDPYYRDHINDIWDLKDAMKGDAQVMADDPDFKAEGIENIRAEQRRVEQEQEAEAIRRIKEQQDQYTEVDMGEDEDELYHLENQDKIKNVEEQIPDNYSSAQQIDDENTKPRTQEEIQAERAAKEEADRKRIKELQDRIVQKAKDRINTDEEYINRKADEYLSLHGKNTYDINEIYSPYNCLYTAQYNFAGFENEIQQLTDQGIANHTMLTLSNPDKSVIPGTNSIRHLTSNPDAKRQIAIDRAKFNEVYDAVYDVEMNRALSRANQLKNVRADDLPNIRILNAIKKHQNIVDSPYFDQVYEKFNDELAIVETAFLNFPANAFYAGVDDDGSKVYKPDEERYERMMERLPFLDIIEENQRFINDVFIPYATRKKAGKLTDEDTKEFDKEYKEHIAKQTKYFGELYKVKENDPDVPNLQLCSTVGFDQAYTKNWLGPRLGKKILGNAEKVSSIIDRGWAVEDKAFIMEMLNVEKILSSVADSEKYNEQQKKQASEILMKMAPAMDELKSTYIVSPEVRDEILDKFADPIKDFVAWDKATVKERVILNQNNNYVGHPIENLYKEAANRKVLKSELGNSPLRYHKEKVSYYENVENNEEKTMIIRKPAGLSDEMIQKNIKTMVDDLHSVELWYKGSSEFKDMKLEMEDLKKYAENTLPNKAMSFGDPQKSYAEALHGFKERALLAQEKIKAYLDHKQVDFDKKATRRDDEGKQGSEQNRINMAIKNYDKLSFMIDRIQEYEDSFDPLKVFEKNEMPRIVQETKNRLDQKIDAEIAKINDEQHPQTRDEYIVSVCTVAMTYMLKNNHRMYKLESQETPEHFQARMNAVPTQNNYTKKDLIKMAQKDPVLKKIITAEVKNYEGKNFVKSSKIDIFSRCADAIKAAAKEHTERDMRKEKSEAFKENLVSTQNKRAREQKEQQKEQNRRF